MTDEEEEEEATSLEFLADYECPECGPPVDATGVPLTEDEATAVLGGDENGILRCPNDWCREELELTPAAALDALRMVAERMPELRARDRRPARGGRAGRVTGPAPGVRVA